MESKALTVASEATPARATAKASNSKAEDSLSNPQTKVLAETEKDSSSGGNWIPVLIVMVIAAAVTRLATRKNKVKA